MCFTYHGDTMSGCWPEAESRVEYDGPAGYPTGEMSVGEADDGYRGLNPGNRLKSILIIAK